MLPTRSILAFVIVLCPQLGKTHVSRYLQISAHVSRYLQISAQFIWQLRWVQKFRKYLEMDNDLENTIFKGEDMC